MTTEQVFKNGVTPKQGEDKGKRFTVKSITPDGVECGDRSFKHGEFELWREPATLFEDSRIPSTWGNLKKAVESKNLPDDTPIVSSHLGGCALKEVSFDLVKPIYDKQLFIVVND